MALLLFIVILSLLVMIHEFGHFIMAKKSGIGVEEFGFGFPPKIWGKKVGETTYTINWIPFGGFVRLVGEDPTDKKSGAKNSYNTKSLWQRSRVVLAGVVMNLLLGIFIFYIVIIALGFKVNFPMYDYKFKFVNQSSQVLIANFAPNSPAKDAGLAEADAILEVNGAKITKIAELQAVTRASEGKPLKLTVENPTNNKTRDVVVTPTYSEELKAQALGIGLGEMTVISYETLPQKLFSGFIHSYNVVFFTGHVFGQFVGDAIAHHDITPVSNNIGGPLAMPKVFGQLLAFGGPIALLQIAALLSLNLAVMNLLPIPALDGGRFAFLVIESITRKRVNQNIEKWLVTGSFVLLVGLMIVISIKDIRGYSFQDLKDILKF